MIIHISGPSGSGKTVLGEKLAQTFGNKIIVKDLDDLRDEFIKEFYGNKKWTYINSKEYQKYINAFILSTNKPLVFVGLNDNNFGKKKLYYEIYAEYKYYIDIDDMIIVKQKCLRLFRDIPNDEIAIHDLVHNNEKFLELIIGAIKRECNAKETIKVNEEWKKDYMKQGYLIMSREDIYTDVTTLLNKVLNTKD